VPAFHVEIICGGVFRDTVVVLQFSISVDVADA